MALQAGCPHCGAPVSGDESDWACPEHGSVEPLWRPAEATYDAFTAHLARADGFPTYLPWPLGPGWSVADFAVVGGRDARGTLTCVSGTSALDGPVDVIVVSEEAGTGLGARVAGLRGAGPTPDSGVGDGPPAIKVRLGAYTVGLWPVSVSRAEGEWDRSVLVGEAEGRWLWLVLRPASALLLLRDDWILRDVSGTGPGLVALPFGGPAPTW